MEFICLTLNNYFIFQGGGIFAVEGKEVYCNTQEYCIFLYSGITVNACAG